MSTHLIQFVFLVGLAHIYGCQVLRPTPSSLIGAPWNAPPTSPLRVYPYMEKAPEKVWLYRHKSTGEVYDTSSLPPVQRTRFSKNKNIYELISIEGLSPVNAV